MKIQDIFELASGGVSRLFSTLSGFVAQTTTFRHVERTATQLLDFLRRQSPTINNMVNAYQQSPDVRAIFHHAFVANLAKYALPVMAYEGYIKPLTIEGTSYEHIVDYPVKLFFCGVFVCMFVNNVAYHASLSKALQKFVPDQDSNDPCKCIGITRLQAGFANTFHYMGNVGSGALLQFVPGVIEKVSRLSVAQSGNHASYVVKAFAYGYCLVSMKYANHGVCAKHQRAIVNNNKLYCFLVGASLLMANRCGSYVLNTIARTEDNAFIDDAMFSYLFQFFIMHSMLKAGSLSANKKAADLFYLQRHYMDEWVRYCFSRLAQESKSKSDEKSHVQVVNSFLETPLARQLASTTAVSLMLSLHGDDVKSALSDIVYYHGFSSKAAEYLSRYLAPEAVVVLIKIIRQHGWKETQALLNDLIDIASKQRAITLAKLDVVKKDDEDFVNLIAAEMKPVAELKAESKTESEVESLSSHVVVGQQRVRSRSWSSHESLPMMNFSDVTYDDYFDGDVAALSTMNAKVVRRHSWGQARQVVGGVSDLRSAGVVAVSDLHEKIFDVDGSAQSAVRGLSRFVRGAHFFAESELKQDAVESMMNHTTLMRRQSESSDDFSPISPELDSDEIAVITQRSRSLSQ